MHRYHSLLVSDRDDDWFSELDPPAEGSGGVTAPPTTEALAPWERAEADAAARRREQREQTRGGRQRAYRRRRLTAGAVLLLLVGGGAWAAFALLGSGSSTSHAGTSGGATSTTGTAKTVKKTRKTPGAAHAPLPKQVRGVHVSVYIASIPSRIDDFLSLAKPGGKGLNTLEVDLKDENGNVGFLRNSPRLAHLTGAAQNFYDARELAAKVHAHHVYLIGRIVCFEDPVTSSKNPGRAIRTTSGGVWQNAAGLGWLNPYDTRNWDYLIQIGKAAALQGFDEIQFDYVRFPTDGDLSQAVFPHKTNEAYSQTLVRFLTKARKALHPLGVRISADVFGLSASHNLGIGQNVKRIAPLLDAISPMAYPSHYYPGEFNITNPDDAPGRIVSYTMRDFRKALRGTKTQIRPWLQDFSLQRHYTLADVKAQIRAAEKGGAKGWLLWNAAVQYSSAALNS